MHLTLQRPRKEILPIVAKLLGGLALEKGEGFEFFPIPQELEGTEGPPTSTPRKGRTLLFLNWSNISNPFKLMS